MIYYCIVLVVGVFFKQKTAYERLISDWSSDVCSSDLQIKRFHDGDRVCFLPDAGVRRARKLPGAEHCQQPRLELANERHLHVSRPIGKASGRERVCSYV